jgi:hypothetical protein
MICIGCGCDEGHACNVAGEACQWIHVGPAGTAGICSGCLELFPPSTIADELAAAEQSLEIYGDFPGQGMQVVDAPSNPHRLILPGDADFHL